MRSFQPAHFLMECTVRRELGFLITQRAAGQEGKSWVTPGACQRPRSSLRLSPVALSRAPRPPTGGDGSARRAGFCPLLRPFEAPCHLACRGLTYLPVECGIIKILML